jgi:tRNA threonylcarbamoyladenosine biosynthesis protein TsaB
MTTTLAFDTCFGALSVAIARTPDRGSGQALDRTLDRESAELLAHAFERRTMGHAEALVPMIARLLDEAGLDMGAIERLAVTLGPGSFTGLRVGIAAARALALARGLPVVGVTSLQVMAAVAIEEGAGQAGPERLAVAIDARRDQHYVQAFTMPAPTSAATLPLPLAEPRLLTTAEAVADLGAAPLLIVGSGAAAIGAARSERGLVSGVGRPDLEADARLLALEAHRLVPMAPVTPLYIRAPDAKPPREAPL